MTAASRPLDTSLALPAAPGGAFVVSGPQRREAGGGETPLPRSGSGAIKPGAPWEPSDTEVARVSSLASYRVTEPTGALETLANSHPCGPKHGWMVSRETRRQRPARCQRLTCDYCLPREAAIRQLILAESMPDTMWSQTLVADGNDPDPWPVVHYRMKIFLKTYRREAPMREFSYVVEKNPGATGYHIHALCRGPKFDLKALKKAQMAANMGIHGNDIRTIGRMHEAADYGMKGFKAAGYGLKGYSASQLRREALRINGNRLEHHTKGFIQVDGKPATVGEARKAIMEKKYGKMDGWVWYNYPVADWFFDVAGGVAYKQPAQSLLDDL